MRLSRIKSVFVIIVLLLVYASNYLYIENIRETHDAIYILSKAYSRIEYINDETTREGFYSLYNQVDKFQPRACLLFALMVERESILEGENYYVEYNQSGIDTDEEYDDILKSKLLRADMFDSSNYTSKYFINMIDDISVYAKQWNDLFFKGVTSIDKSFVNEYNELLIHYLKKNTKYVIISKVLDVILLIK